MFGSGGLGFGIAFTLTNNATGPANAAGQAVLNLQNVVSNAASSIQSASSAITSGIVATVTAVMMLLGPFQQAVEASTEFNFQISRAAAMGQFNAEQVSQLKQAAFDLGLTTMYDALAIAETEVVLTQAGYAVQQQLEMLPGLTDLATAGVVELDYAANVASDTLFQFGLATKDMDRVADVIVNAANMSNMSVQDFAGAMKYFGPTAKGFNIMLEESAGYIEMMANSGMRGSVGTRAFGTSLANLASPSKQAAEMMAEIGFNAFDSAGKFIGLEQMVRKFQGSISGLTEKEQKAAISVIFGNESIQEMLQLLNMEYRAIENGSEVIYKGADALHYFTQKNLEAKGVAAQVAAGIRDNLKIDIKMLTAAFETFKIKMGDILEDSLRDIVQEMRQWVISASALMDTDFGKWLVIAGASVATLASGMIVLGFVITILIPAIWSMVTAVGALMIELAPIIAVVGLVVGLFILAKKSIDEFNSMSESGTGFIGFMQKVGGILMSVYEIWTSWNGSTFTLSEQLHDALQKIGLLDFVLSLATWIVRIKEFFNGLIEGVILTYVIIEAAAISIYDSIMSVIHSFDEMGLSLSKITGETEPFRLFGFYVGFVAKMISIPLLVLTTIFNVLASAIEFVVVNFKEFMKLPTFYPMLKLLDLFTDYEYEGGMPSFKNTFKNNNDQGKILFSGTATSGFNMGSIMNRQAEIMAGLGIRSDGTGTATSTVGPQSPYTIILQNMMDSEMISEKVFEKEALKNARN
jgi:TP901 family phage tail tape measure protein